MADNNRLIPFRDFEVSLTMGRLVQQTGKPGRATGLTGGRTFVSTSDALPSIEEGDGGAVPVHATLEVDFVARTEEAGGYNAIIPGSAIAAHLTVGTQVYRHDLFGTTYWKVTPMLVALSET